MTIASRASHLFCTLFLLITIVWAPSMVAAQEGTTPAPLPNCRVQAGSENVNIRSGPAPHYAILATLPAGQTLPLFGANGAGDWYAVQFDDAGGQPLSNAWIAAEVTRLQGECDILPTIPDPDPPDAYLQLMDVPILPERISPRVHEIVARGQALGNDPHAFTKIGDCNTDTSYFLAAFDWGDYDLGPYTALEPSIDYYDGWFEHTSLAGKIGFNATTVLDPMWSDPKICEPQDGEGPLACEYRLTQPSVVVMMFGPNDMIGLTDAQFEDAVRGILDLSIEQGVIPVITTFTWHENNQWETSLRFNAVLVDLAQEYELPLINLWRAARSLPNFGLIADYTHLTAVEGAESYFAISFAHGEEAVSGYALRNLLTLQTLDLLRREVFAG